MKFSIITPTYRRADMLRRAVASVVAQTYSDWEMIIVNDSPDDASYQDFASSINDPRISYHVNPINKGVNFSRNYALDKVSADSKWVIFLDDDDYLSPDALKIFHGLIETHTGTNWFITNRAYTDGVPVTKIKSSDRRYSYIRDYLLLRRIKGDVTHAINTNSIHHTRFSKYVKQGEEWIFFYELGLREKMFYHDHNSTLTDGYGKNGLNFRQRSLQSYLKDLSILSYEGIKRGLWYHPTFFFYLSGRLIKRLLRW
jgi:glycosyltransferase involved in cell wall biosynthesis